MERKIIHIDMDAFYASVEQRDNPELRGIPLAVGHAEERGVVAAASYEARKFGVRSAMSSQRAKRLCPQLTFVSGRMDVYKAVSRQIHEIFHEYTDIVEPLSLDEAFLDVTENKQNIPLAVDIAKAIKQKIHNGEQLRACSQEMLTRQFGKAGILYYEFSRGIDLRPVEAVRIRKSVGCEHTLEKDISQQSSVIIELYHVATELIERLQRTGFKGNTLTLKIKFHDFNQKTRSITQSHELTTLAEILPLAKGLLKDIEYTTHPIRLIGLSVSNPYEKNEEKARWEQLSFEFSDWDYSK